MAHSDALIFLTNVTWIFFLFFFVYIFLVVFFLPTFYKKFRFRFFFKLKNEFFSIFHFVVLLDSLFVSARLLGYFMARLSDLFLKLISNKRLFVEIWLRKLNNLTNSESLAAKGGKSSNFISYIVEVANREGLFFLR